VKSDISYSSILRLATPIVIANLSQMVLGIIDTAMVGAISSTLLASAALVNSLLAIPTILGIGLAIGLSPLLLFHRGLAIKPFSANISKTDSSYVLPSQFCWQDLFN
jgi:hypothetical protein